MSSGIDVSRHQDVNWYGVRDAGYEWAYIKATEGIGYVDPLFDAHVDAARSVGFTIGGYHFARPDTNPPEADAEHFATELNARGLAGEGNLPPCLDIERDNGGDLAEWVRVFIAETRRITGRHQIMVYASTSWFRDKLNPDHWLDDGVRLWVAHYGRTPGQPGYLTDKVCAHQYTDTGRLPGIDGHVDLNVCMVELSRLTEH
ncbi:glycoside hydrolase family 25 protein [Allokutzneria albata]|uniref:Glycosyl hydrolases family 25 n=1 Tax=Allokutzneria albata TaxID=211114 RepID=A0A1G9RAF4_ALLAB|nr:glycoside hydrolase family 25 protein [Allokutzneria albata]SDM20208.1 Glycosyl hydrolases family 25 [Allokutzneria albata]